MKARSLRLATPIYRCGWRWEGAYSTSCDVRCSVTRTHCWSASPLSSRVLLLTIRNLGVRCVRRLSVCVCVCGWSQARHAIQFSELDDKGCNLLHYTCMYNYASLVPVLLAHGGDPNSRTQQGSTPLHLACAAGHGAIAEALLKNGADAAACDAGGWSAADRHARVRPRLCGATAR